MLSQKARGLFKDVLLVGLVFAAMSGAYLGFAYVERYRAGTAAHMLQDEALIQILNQQAQKAAPNDEE